MRVAICLLGLLALTQATVYFKETFDGDWQSRWVTGKDSGKWDVAAGDFYGDAEAGKGLRTTQDAKFYAISSKFDKPFTNTGKDLVVQLSVKHAQKIDCGGGYVKVMTELDQPNFNGESPYKVMFGPDICGSTTKKTHVILNYKNENKLIKPEIVCETDQLSHVYTLIVHPDQTYEVRIDGNSKKSGSLLEDWDFLPPKKIKDPSVSKPSDWVDEALIDDPSDTKPDDWDSVPRQVADPDAEKPDDWDDEADGEWEAPMIDNPEWKGEWKAKRIANPEYKGKWVHPEIDNPEYVEDKNIYAYEGLNYIGFDLWQVKSGTIFDNIIVTDSVKEAEDFLAETYTAHKDDEKKMFDDIEKAKRDKEEAERKKSEEETKSTPVAEDDDDDDDDDDVHDEL